MPVAASLRERKKGVEAARKRGQHPNANDNKKLQS